MNACPIDDCDLSHCAKCGTHMLGAYLAPGTICTECQAIEREEWERRQDAIASFIPAPYGQVFRRS